MEKTKQQITISVERQQQISALVETDGYDVSIKFDTEGKVTTSGSQPPSTVDKYDEAKFLRPLGRSDMYKMAEHGYFCPDFDPTILLTLHVVETRRGQFNVTINAYRRSTTVTKGIDPQYLGSKVAQVGCKL